MILDPLTLWLLFLPFLTLAVWLFIRALLGISRSGFSCYRAFAVSWVFAYALPVFLFLVSPRIVADDIAIGWMDSADWMISVVMAVVGYILFVTGYRFGKRVKIDFRAGISYAKKKTTRKVNRTKVSTALILLTVCIILQLYPIYLVLSQGITIEFTYRQLHWRRIGLALYLFYLSLPAAIIALVRFLDRPSKLRGSMFLLVLLVSITSAILLGQRMVMALIPFALFLTYSSRRTANNLLVLGLAFGIVFLWVVGYKFLLREGTLRDLGASFYAVLLGDFTRNSILAYIGHHMNFLGSDLLSPPILSSYLYWVILPISRAVWSGKPYVATLQFNHHFGYSLNIAHLAKPVYELHSGYAFGLIDEALLNLGFAGFLLIAAWGFIAARIDRTTLYPLSTKVTLPIFFCIATIYPFHSTWMLMSPFIIVVFLSERIARILI